MFLAIDAGNSNVVFAIYDDKKGKWTSHFRIETHAIKFSSLLLKEAPLYFLEHGIDQEGIHKIGFSSVVPEINPQITVFCQKFFGLDPYLISSKSYAKLPVTTQNPNEIGTDLMCNATAAYLKHKKPLIVVDFGTALTFTVLNGNGEIIGVNIVPGLKTALNSLFQKTSKLPSVELKMPESALGQNTTHAIQAGILYGYTGLVKGMIGAIETETDLKFQVIATGGLSEVLTPLAEVFQEIDKNLTLEGLRYITVVNT